LEFAGSTLLDAKHTAKGQGIAPIACTRPIHAVKAASQKDCQAFISLMFSNILAVDILAFSSVFCQLEPGFCFKWNQIQLIEYWKLSGFANSFEQKIVIFVI